MSRNKMKDYNVTIVTKDKIDSMYVKAKSKKEAIDMVKGVVFYSGLYNIQSLEEIKVKCEKIILIENL